MTHNTTPPSAGISAPARSVVLVGLMGAGKTSIGKRLAVRLGLPFIDADTAIEEAAGCSIADVFSQYGEDAFRDLERRVILRLLSGPAVVLATGGGAFMDPDTRAAIRARAVSVWLRCALPVLLHRVAGRTHRPLLNAGEPAEILARLMALRHPVYAEADIIVDCSREPPEVTTTMVQTAIETHVPPRRLAVALADRTYDIAIGAGLLHRAGALLAPVLPQKRAVIVSDETVAVLHLQTLKDGLAATGVETVDIVVPAGEASKCFATLERVVDDILSANIERRTTVIALGGGVVGDLAGFAAAITLRGLPFVQIPTTLLSQVDSSVGGKTGINTKRGKNLAGAFHQPRMVLADTDVLATLPRRALAAGWAEIAKAGLIGDAEFFAWCEAHGAAAMAGDAAVLAEAVERACAFKAAVVADDEREEKADGGRALLNLGHTFGHALEAETGYGAALLHGEGVAIGLGLAYDLSARLGYCSAEDAARVRMHIEAVGLPARIGQLNRRFSAEKLLAHMRKDKKVRDGAITFVLARGIGEAFTARDIDPAAVRALLIEEGCDP